MKMQIALVLTGVMFGLLCAGLATFAYKTYEPKTCVVEYYKKSNEVHRWTGRDK